jgi:chitinase
VNCKAVEIHHMCYEQRKANIQTGTYTGPNSTATPGKCTNTAGYISNWEIEQILLTPGNQVQQYFSNAAGDIMVYNNTQWISYMTTETYNSRLQWAQSLNFGGTSDWAMDLADSYYSNGTEVGTGSGDVYVDPSALAVPNPTIACTPPCNFILPPWVLSSSTVITPDPVTSTILDMYQSTETLSNGITTTVFVSVTTITIITLPPITTDTISVYNVEWTDVDETIIYFTTSIIPPPVILTESPDIVTSGSTTTLPGVIFTYSPGVYTGPGLPTTTPIPPPPPPPSHVGSVHVTKGPPKATCHAGLLGCGTKCKILCHISVPCIGICGCIGPGCPGGGKCLGGGCGAGGGGNEGETSCSVTHTVSDCEVGCSVTDYGTSTAKTCYSTSCVTVEACAATGWTTTSATTTFNCPWTTELATDIWTPDDPNGPLPVLGAGGIFGYTYITGANPPVPVPAPTGIIPDCSFHGQDPDNGVVEQYCVCGGVTYPATTNTAVPGNMCAYTTLPVQTTSISTMQEVVTSNCQVCTYMGENAQCSMLSGCTPTTYVTATVTMLPPPPAPVASCKRW